MPGEWLPLERALGELRVTAGTPEAELVDGARLAAAAYVERVRPDLWTLVGEGEGAVRAYAPDEAVLAGALMLTARLYARRSSPLGLASFGEFGPAAVVRLDTDIERLLGVGRHARPVVG